MQHTNKELNLQKCEGVAAWLLVSSGSLGVRIAEYHIFASAQYEITELDCTLAYHNSANFCIITV
jgi:hypothetical protein